MTKTKKTPLFSKLLTDITTDGSTGRFVYEKVGAVIAHLVAAFIVIYSTVYQKTLSAELFLIYLSFAGGNAMVSKALTLKYKSNKSQQEGQ